MDTFFNQDCISGMKEHIDDDSIDLIISDPPFGIQGDKMQKHYNRNENNVVEGYVEVPKEEYPQFSKDWIKQSARVLRPGGSIYIFSGYTNLKDILIALDETKLKLINHIIWRYSFGVWTVNKYVSSHYHLLYYYKPGGERTFNTYSRFSKDTRMDKGGSANYADREDVWNINKEYRPNKKKAMNQLPSAIIEKIIAYSSNENDTVLDIFLGSFTTVKATRKMKRKCIGFEISKSVFKYGLESLESVA